MRRLSLFCILILFCGLPAYCQFWNDFGWEESHCQSCLWMERALRLPERKAAEYHRLIHTYGKKIEKETRRDSRHWDRAARNIYKYRMERDGKIQYILTPAQFNLYVRYSRERPQRIHDYRGWYNNPHYPNYHPSHDCSHYEEDYWNYRWNNVRNDSHWKEERRDRGRSQDDNNSYNNGRAGSKGRQPAKSGSDRSGNRR